MSRTEIQLLSRASPLRLMRIPAFFACSEGQIWLSSSSILEVWNHILTGYESRIIPAKLACFSNSTLSLFCFRWCPHRGLYFCHYFKKTHVLFCPLQNDCSCYCLYWQPVFSHWTFDSDAWTWESLCPQFRDNQNYWSQTLNYQRRTGQSVSHWTTKGHGKYKNEGMFAGLPYFHFTVVFCGFKMDYTANTVVSERLAAWKIWRRWSGNICFLFLAIEELRVVK